MISHRLEEFARHFPENGRKLLLEHGRNTRELLLIAHNPLVKVIYPTSPPRVYHEGDLGERRDCRELARPFFPVASRGFRPMDMQECLKNRLQFPLTELAQYAGEYVAWSPDGTRIVASSRDLEVLEDLIRAAGENPEECVVEGIPDSDSVIGA